MTYISSLRCGTFSLCWLFAVIIHVPLSSLILLPIWSFSYFKVNMYQEDMRIREQTNINIFCEPNRHTAAIIFDHEPEKAFPSLEGRTQVISNLRSLAEVELVIQEVQEPRDEAGHSKYAVRGARAISLHHVAANKAARTLACNTQLCNSRGYCRQNRLFKRENCISKTCLSRHSCYSLGCR